jgi:hypothetical protein
VLYEIIQMDEKQTRVSAPILQSGWVSMRSPHAPTRPLVAWRHHGRWKRSAADNFCRPHQTLTKKAGKPIAPALAAGVEAFPWSVTQLAELLDWR